MASRLQTLAVLFIKGLSVGSEGLGVVRWEGRGGTFPLPGPLPTQPSWASTGMLPGEQNVKIREDSWGALNPETRESDYLKGLRTEI